MRKEIKDMLIDLGFKMSGSETLWRNVNGGYYIYLDVGINALDVANAIFEAGKLDKVSEIKKVLKIDIKN